MKRLMLAFGLFGLTASPGVAAEQLLTLNPQATSIAFHLEATGHDVEGAFELLDGTIRFDPDTGEASGQLRIDAAHAGTGNKKRDKTMHRKVLESESYPLFVFHAERIQGTLPERGEADLQLHGTLTMHGADHPLTLSTHVEVDGEQLIATTSFPIPFVEWGLHDPSWFVLRVAKEVEVKVTAHGRITATVASLR